MYGEKWKDGVWLIQTIAKQKSINVLKKDGVVIITLVTDEKNTLSKKASDK